MQDRRRTLPPKGTAGLSTLKRGRGRGRDGLSSRAMRARRRRRGGPVFNVGLLPTLAQGRCRWSSLVRKRRGSEGRSFDVIRMDEGCFWRLVADPACKGRAASVGRRSTELAGRESHAARGGLPPSQQPVLG